ncbi:hypothetical protein BJ165DRAFT_1406939 [Panaeolus papilionaceus]|nr:hypothetical protein BJ165DRAFT_1406939 [Panaeolus papilionaceus]
MTIQWLPIPKFLQCDNNFTLNSNHNINHPNTPSQTSMSRATRSHKKDRQGAPAEEDPPQKRSRSNTESSNTVAPQEPGPKRAKKLPVQNQATAEDSTGKHRRGRPRKNDAIVVAADMSAGTTNSTKRAPPKATVTTAKPGAQSQGTKKGAKQASLPEPKLDENGIGPAITTDATIPTKLMSAEHRMLLARLAELEAQETQSTTQEFSATQERLSAMISHSRSRNQTQVSDMEDFTADLQDVSQGSDEDEDDGLMRVQSKQQGLTTADIDNDVEMEVDGEEQASQGVNHTQFVRGDTLDIPTYANGGRRKNQPKSQSQVSNSEILLGGLSDEHIMDTHPGTTHAATTNNNRRMNNNLVSHPKAIENVGQKATRTKPPAPSRSTVKPSMPVGSCQAPPSRKHSSVVPPKSSATSSDKKTTSKYPSDGLDYGGTLVPALYYDMYISSQPFPRIQRDSQKFVDHIQRLFNLSFPNVRRQLTIGDPVVITSYNRLASRRSLIAKKSYEVVSTFFSGKMFRNKEEDVIRSYARYAIKGDGPMYHAKPSPQQLAGHPEHIDYIAPTGFFQSEFIIDMVQQFLSHADSAPQVNTAPISAETPPKGLYALVLAGLERAFVAFRDSKSKDQLPEFSQEKSAKAINTFIAHMQGSVSENLWTNILDAINHTGDDSAIREGPDDISICRDNLFIPQSPVKRTPSPSTTEDPSATSLFAENKSVNVSKAKPVGAGAKTRFTWAQLRALEAEKEREVVRGWRRCSEVREGDVEEGWWRG